MRKCNTTYQSFPFNIDELFSAYTRINILRKIEIPSIEFWRTLDNVLFLFKFVFYILRFLNPSIIIDYEISEVNQK